MYSNIIHDQSLQFRLQKNHGICFFVITVNFCACKKWYDKMLASEFLIQILSGMKLILKKWQN